MYSKSRREITKRRHRQETAKMNRFFGQVPGHFRREELSDDEGCAGLEGEGEGDEIMGEFVQFGVWE